jgi:pyruvate ferredoxin oxidoreductase gamma subunit
MMFAVRIHGRGGQGVVTAAEMLSVAAFAQGLHAQAFPTFGSERTGAPVVAYCRIDEAPLRAHDPVDVPDALLVQDPTLLHQIRWFEGMSEHSYLLVNTARPLNDLRIDEHLARLDPHRVATVAATDISRRLLGRALPNTGLLGAFAAQTGQVNLESVSAAIRRRFDGMTAEANVGCASEAFDAVSATVSRQFHD